MTTPTQLHPEQLYELADRLVDDLVDMDRSTAIELDTWPNAKALVDAIRPATIGSILERAARSRYQPGREFAEKAINGLRASAQRERR